MLDFLFLLLGLFTGCIGTLVGAGGGFLISPVLIFVFPEMSPSHLTAISLLTVCANSTSGTIGYTFRKQVHWKSTLLFSLFAIPGVFIGVELSQIIRREDFEIYFAAFLFAMGWFVIWRSRRPAPSSSDQPSFWTRSNQILGSAISFFIGILSSLLGIGGGIIHVPLLSEALKYPLHLAAGTSHAILAITSMVAVAEHWRSGDYSQAGSYVPFLVVGLVVGAQAGAALSKKIPKKRILLLLGAILFLVSIRLFLRSFK